MFWLESMINQKRFGSVVTWQKQNPQHFHCPRFLLKQHSEGLWSNCYTVVYFALFSGLQSATITNVSVWHWATLLLIFSVPSLSYIVTATTKVCIRLQTWLFPTPPLPDPPLSRGTMFQSIFGIKQPNKCFHLGTDHPRFHIYVAQF